MPLAVPKGMLGGVRGARMSVLAFLLAACNTDPAKPHGDTDTVPPTDSVRDTDRPDRASNLLLLIADDVGVDKVSAYGRPNAPETPNIDSLAAQGVRFETAWAGTLCSPGRALLETGRYGRRTGYGDNLGVQFNSAELHLGETTLPEIFKAGGATPRATSLVGKWHLAGYSSASAGTHPNLQGYDWWGGTLGNLDDTPVDLGRPGYFNWEKLTNGESTVVATYATVESTNDALARVAAMPEPWMLTVAFNAGHEPWHVPPAELLPIPPPIPADAISKLYNASVLALDTEIGRLLSTLPADVRARTNIVFVSDNGTPDKAIVAPLDPLRAKATLYDGGVQVPLIFSGPIVADPGRVVGALVGAVDLFPTVAELAGADLSSLHAVTDPTAPLALDGLSLVPYLDLGRTPDAHPVIYAEQFVSGPAPYDGVDKVTVRNVGYKLLRDRHSGSEYLFAYVAGAWDEGPALDPKTMGSDAIAAYEVLKVQLDTIVAGLAFDGEWVEGDVPPDTGASN